MSHLVAISPHLDDAAFSIGGTMAAHVRDGGRVTIVTCFTGTVAQPEGFALACQLDKGLPPEVDYMALRRREDAAACAVIGAAAVHLPFLEAPHRGYGDAAALFGERRADDAIVAPLAAALTGILADLAPDLVAGPLALGGHVDHGIVREAVARVAAGAVWWEDWPYRDRVARGSAGPLVQVTMPDAELRGAHLAMCACYASQIDFQFGGLAALAERIAAVTEERLFAG